MTSVPPSEAAYDRLRLGQWSRGRARSAGIDRRDLLKLVAAASVAAPLVPAAASPAHAAQSLAGVVKPLPPELFTIRGTNAETNFAALRDTGLLTPADRFFVRNHTSTPVLDPDSWKLTVWGSGLTGAPADFTYEALRALPSVTRTAFVECAGNGRSFFTTQQNQPVGGTAWTLGAIGTARWRGVRLADVLRRAGIGRHAVDVLPRGLDAEVVSDGTNLGRVRRPLPVAKALDDVLLAYEMNGEPLPPDHGAPVRLIVPSWVGIANIKWVGDIEVSAEPLLSPWNTGLYRLFGPGYPPRGQRAAQPPDAQERVRAGPGCHLHRPPRAPAHRPLVVGGRAGALGRGQHGRRRHLASCPVAGRAPGRELGPLDGPLGSGGGGSHGAARPGHGPGGPHPARDDRPQHAGLPLRRGGAAPGDRGLSDYADRPA